MSHLTQKLSASVTGAVRHLLGRELSGDWATAAEQAHLEVECSGHWPEIRGVWDRLHAAVPGAAVFQSYVWQQAVFRMSTEPGPLRLITVWAGGSQLVAVVPLSIHHEALLVTPGSCVSDYLDPLIHPAFERQVWPAILHRVAQLLPRNGGAVVFPCVRDGAPCRQFLPVIAPLCGFSYHEQVSGQTAVLALPRTWDDYLAILDPHERKEVRRKLNKAQTKAGARMSRCEAGDTDGIRAGLAKTFALMEQAPGEKGEAVRHTLRPLLETVAPVLIAEGRLWLSTLELEGQPAAVTLQFPHAGGPQLYNCGYDVTRKEWSPGIVLASLLIQQAIDAGATEFDMLRGQAPYKYKLGARDRPLLTIALRKV